MAHDRKTITKKIYFIGASILFVALLFVLINLNTSLLKVDKVKAVSCVGGGVSYNGYCYYYGNLSESCNTTCQNKGSTCDSAGALYVHSSSLICSTVGQLLNGNSTAGGTFSGTIGCYYNVSASNWRLSSSAPLCTTSSSNNRPACACAPSNPVPVITEIITGDASSSMKAIGGSSFWLAINGSNFISSSTVNINGSLRTTLFASSTSILATILASDIASVGTSSITVFNPTPGGGTSSPAYLSVYHALPSLSSISPTSTYIGGTSFALTLTGTNFDASSTVYWNSSSTATTFVNSNQITSSIPSAYITTFGTSTIRVFNPTPVGGFSSSSSFTVALPPSAPATPQNFTATAASSSAINLTWSDVATETSYRIERAKETSSGSYVAGTYATVALPASNATSYQDTGLEANTLYYYKIYAVNVDIDGLPVSASALTPQVAHDVLNASDFKVQRNCTIANAASTTVTLLAGTNYTSPNSTSSAFIRLVSTRGTGMGLTLNGGSQDPDQFAWYISDPDFTDGTVKFTRVASSIGSVRFCWEIVEYIGVVGGPNEIKVRSANTVTYVSNGLTVDGSNVSGADPNKVVVFITGQNNITNILSRTASGQSTAYWNQPANVGYPTFTRATNLGSYTNSLSYAVVEFTGSNWNVERVEHPFVAPGIVEYEPLITNIGSINRAFFHVQFRRSDTSSMLNAGPAIWLSGTNQISFLLDAGASAVTNKTAVVWVISNTDESSSAMKVQHVSSTRLTADISQGASNNEDEWTNNISAVASREGTSIMGENGISTGSGGGAPYGWLSLYLASTTGVKLYQSDDAKDQYYYFDVVQWPQPKINTNLSSYRLFNNTNSSNVTSSLASQNTSATLNNSGDAFRLRSLIYFNSVDHSASLPTSSQKYFLQYGKKNGSCDSSATGYGNINSSTAIAFKHNASVVDGAPLIASSEDPTVVGHIVVSQSYKESNPFTNNQSSILSGKGGLWDFSLYDNGAPAGTTYCIRAINDKPWNIKENLVYENKYFNVPGVSNPHALNMSTNGDHMYLYEGYGSLWDYPLSTPWNVATAQSPYYWNLDNSATFLADIYSETASTKVHDVSFGNDGKKMYALTDFKDPTGVPFTKIFQFTLTEPWQITTAIYDGVSADISNQFGKSVSGAKSWAFSFGNDGQKLYVTSLFPVMVHQYTLTQNWNLSTVSHDNGYMGINSGVAYGITFNGDGAEMYLAGGAIGNTILSEVKPNWIQKIWAFITSPLESIWPNVHKANAQLGVGGGVPPGISSYTLSTPWDIRSATFDVMYDSNITSGIYALQGIGTEGVAVNAEGNKIYYLGTLTGGTGISIFQYSPITDLGTYLDSYSSIAEITTAAPTLSNLIQKNYRWYKDDNTKDPTNTASLENTEMSNLVLGRNRHLRISVQNPSGNFSAGQQFRLQYQRNSTSSSGWSDVGPGQDFKGADICTSCSDGSPITALRLTDSTVTESYEEPTGNAISTTTPNAINDGAVAEWDWALTTNGTLTAGATYYFRMIGADGTVFGTYLNYPKLTISGTNSSIGEVTSVIYDTGSLNGAQLNSFYWDGPLGGDVQFKFASASTSTPPEGWNFFGPRGIGGDSDWYSPSGPNIAQSINPQYHKNLRYYRYKIRLGSTSGVSPVVKKVIINWSP